MRDAGGIGNTLKFTDAIAASVPIRTDHELAHVEARDVLHDVASGADLLAFERDERHADHHVARGAVVASQRPALIGRNDAADGGWRISSAERRIERQHLAVLGERAFELGHGMPASTEIVRSRGSYFSSGAGPSRNRLVGGA